MRRQLLFSTAALVAPRPTDGAKAREPIIVAGALRTASGLGEAARLSFDALRLAGGDVYGIDLSADLMQPVDAPKFDFANGQDLIGTGTIILHVNAPLVPLALTRLGQRLVRDKYIVGYWAWELPSLPEDWAFGFSFVHEIWTPSNFVADAVRPRAGTRPVRILPHPVAIRRAGTAPPASRRGGFTVLTVFNAASSFARKNPIATIKAFKRAFGDDPTARLTIKLANSAAFPAALAAIHESIGGARNVEVRSGVVSAEEIDSLYGASDVVISLHRSEGFGLTLTEAMARGLPVVATNWSGNVDFLNDQNGRPIPYRLVPAEDPQGTYHHPSMLWADPDVDAAADALGQLRREPQLSRLLGEAGAAYAEHHWSSHSFTQFARRHLGL
jgi:glycosyltransferase involved in cell wall biosynthesis